jgi:hypothetical protein
MKAKAYAAVCPMSLGNVYRVFRGGVQRVADAPRYCVP